MKRGIRVWKLYARRALKGNYMIPIAATFIVNGLQLMAGMLTGNLFPGTGILDRILEEIFLFGIALIMCIFTAGLYHMYLNMSRGLSYGLNDLVYFFKHKPDRVIVASFVLALISWLTSLPAEYYSYTSEMGTTLEEQTTWAATYLMITMFFMIVNLFLSLPFALTYYLIADEEELGGIEALKKSICMMKGNILKYIALQLSFIPWMIASLFTLYVGFLWLIPYMEMSVIMFYRDLRGEFDPVMDSASAETAGSENALINSEEISVDIPKENAGVDSENESENDYNAEA